MAKGIYHSELVKNGETVAQMKTPPIQSKFQGKPPFCILIINGEERIYQIDSPDIEQALTEHAQTLQGAEFLLYGGSQNKVQSMTVTAMTGELIFEVGGGAAQALPPAQPARPTSPVARQNSPYTQQPQAAPPAQRPVPAARPAAPAPRTGAANFVSLQLQSEQLMMRAYQSASRLSEAMMLERGEPMTPEQHQSVAACFFIEWNKNGAMVQMPVESVLPPQ